MDQKPEGAEYSLLVLGREVALDQKIDQITVLPDFLPVDLEETVLWLDDLGPALWRFNNGVLVHACGFSKKLFELAVDLTAREEVHHFGGLSGLVEADHFPVELQLIRGRDAEDVLTGIEKKSGNARESEGFKNSDMMAHGKLDSSLSKSRCLSPGLTLI